MTVYARILATCQQNGGGSNMLKVNVKVLISLFCIISSCIFTILYLFIVDNSEMNSKTIATTEKKTSTTMSNDLKVEEVDINEEKEKSKTEETEKTNTDNKDSEEDTLEEVVEIKPEIVYDGMTLDELASKLDRSLKNELGGKGYLYASYSLEKGVDPYLAVAISLEETGCNWNCSNLVKTCNNVGGMKGYGCGSYGYFNTLDDGIKAFIDNISRNYVAYGLTTAELMNPKYAENPAWSGNVNNYINIIKNN